MHGLQTGCCCTAAASWASRTRLSDWWTMLAPTQPEPGQARETGQAWRPGLTWRRPSGRRASSMSALRVARWHQQTPETLPRWSMRSQLPTWRRPRNRRWSALEGHQHSAWERLWQRPCQQMRHPRTWASGQARVPALATVQGQVPVPVPMPVPRPTTSLRLHHSPAA